MFHTSSVSNLRVLLYFMGLILSKISIYKAHIFIKNRFIKIMLPAIHSLSKAKLKLRYTSELIYCTDVLHRAPNYIDDLDSIQIMANSLYQKMKKDFI